MKKSVLLITALLISSQLHAGRGQPAWLLTKGIAKFALAAGLFVVGVNGAWLVHHGYQAANDPDERKDIIEEMIKKLSKSNPGATQSEIRAKAENWLDTSVKIGVPIALIPLASSVIGAGLLFKSAYSDVKSALTD